MRDEWDDLIDAQSGQSNDVIKPKKPISKIESALVGGAEGNIPFLQSIVGAAKAPFSNEEKPLIDRYRSERDRAREYFKDAYDQNPISYIGGAVAGSVLPTSPFKKAKTAGDIAKSAALMGLGSGSADLTKIGLDQEGMEELLHGTAEAAISGSLAGAFNKFMNVLKNNATLGKFGKVFAGVNEKFTDHYIKKRGRISNKDLDAVRQEILRRKGDAGSKYDDAKKAFDFSKNKLIESLKSKDLSNPESPIKSEIIELTAKLQDTINSLSEKSQKALRKVPKDIYIPTDFIKKEIRSMMNKKFKKVGTKEAARAKRELESYLELIDRISPRKGEIKAREAGALLKQFGAALPKSVDSPYGNYLKDFDALNSRIYKKLSERLKAVSPEYKAILEGEILSETSGLAEKVKLLKWINNNLGNDQKIISGLANIHKNTKAIARDKINQLGDIFKKDFRTPISESLAARKKLSSKNTMNKLSSELPEYIDLMNAKKLKDAYKPFTDSGTEGVLKATQGARPLYSKSSLEKLRQQTGLDFEDQIMDALTNMSLEKGNKHGSRNVGWGTQIGRMVVGGLLGGAAGDATGAAIGASTGAIWDEFSGPIFRALLNKTISVQEATKKLHPVLGKYAKPIAKAASDPKKITILISNLAKMEDFNQTVLSGLKKLSE